MQQTPEMENYLAFMQWFEQVFTELHAKYAAHISMPYPGGEVSIRAGSVDSKTYDILSEVIREYYEPERKDISFRMIG